MKSQQAFTLVELITVIVILGILAAAALPRFVTLSQDAHLAKIKATAAALRSGAELARSKWLVAGQPTTYSFIADTSHANADTGIDTATGYPNRANDGSSAVSTTLAASEDDCLNLLKNLVTGVSASKLNGGTCNSSFATDFCVRYGDGGTEANRCEYQYSRVGTTNVDHYSILYVVKLNGSGLLFSSPTTQGKVLLYKHPSTTLPF